MQHPTCTNVRIRSTQDAHKIFFAIQQGLLQMVTRRLDADERLALTTGCVYAWEERGPHTEITGLGIERFTEGRRWSPSRVRDEFLFYYEKYSPVADMNNPGASPEKQPPRDWDPLVKQTYSVWVETEKGRRKWHLTAYFTQTTVDDLGTIDDILGVQELVPPPGLFKSTRVGKGRGKPDEQVAQTSDASSKPPTTLTRTYAPFPTLHNRYPSQSESPPASESVMMYEPYENLAYTSYANSDGRSPRYASPPPPQHHQSVSPISPPQPSHFTQYSHTTTPATSYSLQTSTFHPMPSTGTQVQRRRSPVIANMSTPSASYELPSHHQPPSIYSAMPQVPRSQSPTYPTGPPIQPVYTDVPPRLYSPKNIPPVHPIDRMQAPASSYAYSDPNSQYIPPDHPETLPPLHTTLSNYADLIPSVSVPIYGAQQLVRPISDHVHPSYELLPGDPRTSEGRRGSIGPDRDLAPIYALTRAHPYRRDPLDDKTLRLLTPRSS